jgi:hypothetical protein
LHLTYVTVCSTHNHSTPDLLGLWGPSFFRTGVLPEYREKVIDACVKALKEAHSRLQPAKVAFHEIQTPPANLVADTRKPEVYDPNIRVMHVVAAEDHRTLGSITTWGNHPETVWSKNTEVTSDY